MLKYKYLEHFFQDYSDEPELGIPSHWCVKYQEEGKYFVDYSYHSSLDEAITWAKKNTDYNSNIEGVDWGFKDNLLAPLLEQEGQQESRFLGYGHAEPITPEQWFDVKTFKTLKESRTNNIYDYFPIWFEEMCEVDGIYLAGGSLRNLLGGDDIIADIDLFFANKSAVEEAERIMAQYEGSDLGCWYEAFRCPAGELITYKSSIDKPDEDKTQEDYKNQAKVQFITKSFYESPKQLINSFDFIPTCACLYKDVLYTHPKWVQHVKKKTLGLNFISYPVASLSRMIRYSHKGYVVLPDTLLQVVTEINQGEFEDGQLALYID